ncbi:hypothetical protein [Pendulispora albinea]|uniref:Alcohol dehydrogenase n=1 Tax=Pendulispora albinea TaxID=2741071 RepID=A0ABZ2M0T5_9BACT
MRLYRQGRLPLGKLVSRYRLEDINTAVTDIRAGRTIKAVLTFRGGPDGPA